MKRIIQLSIFLWIISAYSLSAQTYQIPSSIELSFRAGNAEELARNFNDNIELIILESEDVYSRSQAEQIIRKFFVDHKPLGFKIIFEGGKENSRYAIGSLATYGSTYRIYILIKKQDEKPLIHQLRIEEEEKNDR